MIELFRNLFNVSQWDISAVDIGVIVGYFILMMVVGWVCKDISKNVSDYVRMGCKSTWWLMGTSIFMMMASAGTFTGDAAQAYLSGWSLILMSAGSIFGYLCMAAFFAPWMRRTRAITPIDTIRMRYGPIVEQVNVYLGLAFSGVWAATWLLGLAYFMAVIFKVPIPTVIIFVGAVAVFYSVAGGSWSVQITDTLQAYILVPIGLVVLFMSLKSVGWFGGLQEAIQAKGLQDDYKIIMEVGHVYTSRHAKVGLGKFSIGWLVGIMLYRFILSANMTACWRFLSTKSDKAARKAALLAGVLLFTGSLVWYIPAMVARVKYEDQVAALSKYVEKKGDKNADGKEAETNAADSWTQGKLNNAADGAYAVVAKNVLPPGMIALVVIGLFAATMSSLDSNLTGQAGIITNNLYPGLARLFGKVPWTGKKLLRLTQVVSLVLGMWAITLAFLMWKWTEGMSLFDVGLEIVGLISAPMVAAMVLSFFVRWLPWWAPLVGMAFGLTVSFTLKFSGDLVVWIGQISWLEGWLGTGIANFGNWVNSLMWHERIFLSLGFSVIPTLATVVFWRTSTPAYRRQVDEFFKKIRTPVDFEKEVGEDADHSIMKIIGTLGLVIAAAITILVFWAKDKKTGEYSTEGILSVLFVSAFIAAISTIMLVIGIKKQREHDLRHTKDAQRSESQPGGAEGKIQ